MTKKRLLVTGAGGFIGDRLCRALQAGGAHVVATVRSDIQGPWDESIPWHIGSGETLAWPKVDAVFHLAGIAHALAEVRQDEDAYQRLNAEGTRQALEAARAAGVRRFVLFSSVKAMGEGGRDCLDETAPCDPQTAYGRSKLAAEKLVLDGGYVPEPVVLRLSMVYGRSEKGNLPRMIRAVAQGRFPSLPDTGNRRSMVHADDVVRAATLAAESPKAIGQTYIVTDGTPYSTRQIHAWICEALGRPAPGRAMPMMAWRLLARMGDGIGRLRGRRFAFDTDALDKLIGSACFDAGKIERELGFLPRHHLRESLPEMIRHLEGGSP